VMQSVRQHNPDQPKLRSGKPDPAFQQIVD
jgi:hypothetical protein